MLLVAVAYGAIYWFMGGAPSYRRPTLSPADAAALADTFHAEAAAHRRAADSLEELAAFARLDTIPCGRLPMDTLPTEPREPFARARWRTCNARREDRGR